MSDINDDLLNYELGDDIDDHDESIGNEDELLLSDEEISQQEEDLLLDDDEILCLSKPKENSSETKTLSCVERKSDTKVEVIQKENPDPVIEDVTTTTKPDICKNVPVNIADSSIITTNTTIPIKESEVSTTNKPLSTRPLLRRNIIDSKKSLEMTVKPKEQSSELIIQQKKESSSHPPQSTSLIKPAISPTKPTKTLQQKIENSSQPPQSTTLTKPAISPTKILQQKIESSSQPPQLTSIIKPIKSPTKTVQQKEESCSQPQSTSIIKPTNSPTKTLQSPNILPSSPTKQQIQLPSQTAIQVSCTSEENVQPNEVSSTNSKDIVNQEEQKEKVQEVIEKQTNENVENDKKITESTDNSDLVKNVDDTVDSSDKRCEDSSVSQSQQSQESSSVTTHDDTVYSSQEPINQPEFETEDSDDGNERLNPKLCVEREGQNERLGPESDNRQRPPFDRKHPMGRGGTFLAGGTGNPFTPHYNPFQTFPSNENFNTPFQQNFRGERPIMHPTGAINNPQMMPRVEFRNAAPFGFPPQQYHNDIRQMRPMIRLPPNGPMPPTYNPFNGHRNIRPGLGAQIPPPLRYDNSRPTVQQFMPMRHSQFIRPGGLMHQQQSTLHHHQQQPQQQQHVPIPHGGPPQQTGRITNIGPLLIPTKVLINPNFKGGVEAVTNKIMMESQYFAQNDAELLRKQEAFINQNRMHIEKRRYERSPDRDRPRERSYSPPVNRRRAHSRERGGGGGQQRRPFNNSYRGGGNAGLSGDNNNTGGPSNRGRRASSKEIDNRQLSKRRRSGSADRDDDKFTAKSSSNDDQQEDEETRAYRQEIEKQKSMREKILRDKEMRRRKAAADIKKEVDEKKQTVDETLPNQKFAPIIVTEKKIISLKKKPDSNVSTATSSSTKHQRNVLTAPAVDSKRNPESNSAMTKQIVTQKPTTTSNDDILEDYYDEDELLADSPPPPSSSHNTQPINHPIAGKFTNRRVILKQSSSSATTISTSSSGGGGGGNKVYHSVVSDDAGGEDIDSSIVSTSTNVKPKGIFERLDRRTGVNENAKRKIQRIVIKNNE